MEKKLIEKEIFHKYYNGDFARVRFGDIPKNLLDDDIIYINREEAYYSENNSSDASTTLVVTRMIIETDEEFTKRINESRQHTEELKKRRYETYLKLKKEFGEN